MGEGARCPRRELSCTMAAPNEADHAELVVDAASPEETMVLGRRLGALLRPGSFIALIGPLGAGKTTFVQGLADGLCARGAITSPTFVLMRLHQGRVPLVHADAYRLGGAADLAELGIEELADECVVALEWADTISDTLPEDRIELRIDYTEEGRRLDIRGHGPISSETVRALQL